METEILKKVKEAVVQIEPSAEIILYGSRARNDHQKWSDWDFLILIEGEVDDKRIDRIRHEMHVIEWDTGEILSSIVRSKAVWDSPLYQVMPLHKNIEVEGIRL